MYIHLAVTVQAVAIPLKIKRISSSLQNKSLLGVISYIGYLALCVIYKSHRRINYNLIDKNKK